jgi:predicted lipoprotein with Yx(FWY)xxD motif
MQTRNVVRILAALGLVVALGGQARAADPDVRVEPDAKVGKRLADGKGMSLYLLIECRITEVRGDCYRAATGRLYLGHGLLE